MLGYLRRCTWKVGVVVHGRDLDDARHGVHLQLCGVPLCHPLHDLVLLSGLQNLLVVAGVALSHPVGRQLVALDLSQCFVHDPTGVE